MQYERVKGKVCSSQDLANDATPPHRAVNTPSCVCVRRSVCGPRLKCGVRQYNTEAFQRDSSKVPWWMGQFSKTSVGGCGVCLPGGALPDRSAQSKRLPPRASQAYSSPRPCASDPIAVTRFHWWASHRLDWSLVFVKLCGWSHPIDPGIPPSTADW